MMMMPQTYVIVSPYSLNVSYKASKKASYKVCYVRFSKEATW